MAAVLLYVCSAFVVWICSANSSSIKGCGILGNSIDCSKRGFLEIPTDLPPWVIRLELQSNGITQIGPDVLKGLPHLEYLDLSKNELEFINGTDFSDLVNLTILKLDSNQLTEIPHFPVAMNVTDLSMVYNHIATIPIEAMEQMPRLLKLDLSHNNLLNVANGSFPKDCRLTYLNLNSNRISAIELGSLTNLTSLEVFKLNRNKLTDLPQAVFARLSKLKTLELVKNHIRMIIGLTFQGLQELHTLKLKRNRISILKDGAFYGLSGITNLYLDNNKIVNITKAWLFGLNSLKQLSLSHNHINNIERDAWRSCPRLEKLDLDHNRLTAITDRSLLHLTSLEWLSMDHNQVARIDEGAFLDLGQLSVLMLNENEISWTMEDISGAFRDLEGLVKLGLRSNRIKSVVVPAFSGLKSLRQLHMEDNDFTAIQENAFETLRNLNVLRFNSSKLYCDCNLAWLPSWLIQHNLQRSAVGTCLHPLALKGTSIYKLDVKKLTCNDSQLPKPVILESPKSANGFKGGNLTLSCTIAITGKGQPDIVWKKDRKPLGNANTELVAESDGEVKRFTSFLHLVDITDHMAGRYHCSVTNDFGSTFSQRAYVNVYVYPVFIKTPKDVTVKKGKPAELKCAATGQPTPVISWQKDGGDNFPAARERRMQVYPNDDRFYIVDTRSADEGVYSCMATNEAGQVVANATVTVLETPDFKEPMQKKKHTRQGETSVLQCRASGSPPPKLTWLKDNKELVVTPRHFFTADSQLLVIVETQWSDAGIYACRMSNSLGTAKGKTELEVYSGTEDANHASSGSSGGLDDESTTTGIIIIAVVCCVVGTSLVWVIIIYQTRKRHEVYSNTPTDETTLPGEVQSSGYMSSDKEGSYSQGLVTTPNGYYYQDYQMKESGYESSSGQYRSSGHPRPLAAFANDDEDDHSPPVVTAGDMLLQQIHRQERSNSSLHYPASDGDTIGSRHSTSSGQHSGSSNPSSSHSGHSANNHQLRIFTNPLAADHYALHPSAPSPSSDEMGGAYSAAPHSGRTLLSPSPDVRPVLQTFHPTKPTNHDRLGRSSPLSHQRERREKRGCDGDGNGKYSRPRHYSDSCDMRDADDSPAFVPSASPPPCAGCLAAQKAAQGQQDAAYLYSQLEGRNLNSRYPDSSHINNNNNCSGRGSSYHLNGADSKPSSYSSLPHHPSHSSSSCHRLRSGSHSRGHSPSHSPHTVEHGGTTPSSLSLAPCRECSNKAAYQLAASVSHGHGHHHVPSPQPPPPPHASHCTNSCSCHRARDGPPPCYNDVVCPNRYNNCVPQSSTRPGSSKVLARSRSSSSVGRDPMYYAYHDRCPSASCCGATSEHKQSSCDDNCRSTSRCSDCDNTSKRKATSPSSSSNKNHRHPKQRSCSSPNHPQASTPLLSPNHPTSSSPTSPTDPSPTIPSSQFVSH